MWKNINAFFVRLEWRLSLFIQATGVVASFALPAWAVRAMEMFSEYAPLSWVVAGFAGVAFAVIFFWLWQVAFILRVRAKFNVRLLEHPDPINPLDKTFEGKRIFLNDFVLPSHQLVEGKTFIDCDIIGPTNLYLASGNQASAIRLPQIDAVYLDPEIMFNNGVAFRDCVFRNCSFQRITMFIGDPDYGTMSDNPVLHWISLNPDSMNAPELPMPMPEITTQEANGDGPKTDY